MSLTRAAVRQAMHYKFGLSYAEITRLYGTSYSTIRDHILGIGVTPWDGRTAQERQAAIDQAARIIERGEA